MSESIHDKLKRVRKPRVHITYDLETSDGTVEKELPFVMGVMGDYSGDNTEVKKPLKDRKFSQIDADNFNDLMTNINPKLELEVKNTLDGQGEMALDLDFKNMEDFEPHKLVENIEPLKKLQETRNKLRDLLTKADRSEELENILEEVLSNTEALKSLKGELGDDAEGGAKDGE